MVIINDRIKKSVLKLKLLLISRIKALRGVKIMKKIINFIIASLLSIVLMGCSNTSVQLNGTYEVKVKNSNEIGEFATAHEYINLDGSGNFTITSYYSRTNFSGIISSLTFAGELVTNIEGKYFVESKEIQLEWFVNNVRQSKTYEFDSTSLFKATYYSDGTLNNKSEVYEKVTSDNLVNIDGTFTYNSSSSDFMFINMSKFRKLVITGSEFEFQFINSLTSITGSLLLGRRNAVLLNVTEFSSYNPVILSLNNNGIEMTLRSFSETTLIFDSE